MIAASPKMLSHILLISTLFAVAFASGQLSILHNPKSLTFKGNEPLAAASLGDVFASAIGFSIDSSSDWSVMSIRTPFDLPRACFLVYLDGSERSPIATKNTFELTGSGSFDSVQSALNRVDHSDLLDLSSGAVAGEIEKVTWSALKPESRPAEKAYLHAIGALYTFVEQLQSAKDLRNFWTLRLPSSQSLVKSGSSVAALAEANKIESVAIHELVAAVKKVYDYDVLIAVVATDEEQEEERNVRHKRQTNGVAVERDVQVSQLPKGLNAAEEYDANYPVIFNILLWFGIAMFFTLVAISYTIGNMDPGRDSIIYRMTSTRMKKDN